MIQTRTMKGGKLTEIAAEDPSKTLRKKGTMQTTRIGRATVKTSEVDLWEEAEISPYTKEEYDEKVNELIRQRYSQSEELAIQRKTLNAILSPVPVLLSEEDTQTPAPLAEYEAYNAFAEECKQRAKDAGLYRREGPGEGQ